MNISANGLKLIKQFEGCKLTAYQDSVGVWTIGWGTTNADKSITGLTIAKGVTITQEQADSFLEKSVNSKYAPKVTKYNTKYNFNQNQFDALVSFAYNIGSIDQLTASGTRTISEISTKILAYNKAGGKELAGLTRRRKAEKTLFDTAVTTSSTSKKTETKTTKPVVATPTLQNGSKGQQAIYLQNDLNYLGYKGKDGKTLTVDGEIGDNSVYALKQFQKKYSLTVDGIYGKNSYAAMHKACK